MDWSVSEGAGLAHLEVSRPKDDRGLYRAWAVGPSGRCALGTLTPQGDRLTLRKTLRRAALEQVGCWPVTAVECQLSFPFSTSGSPLPGWGRIPPDLTWPDPILAQVVRFAGGGSYQKTPQGFLLAYPADCRCPFPLPPIFCFARLKCLAGRPWWVFAFDPDGLPRFGDV